MEKNDLTQFLIFAIVFFMLLSMPYWVRSLGAVSQIDTRVNWCFHEPEFIKPKPTWVNVPQGGSETFVAYVGATVTTAPGALDSVNVYSSSSYFSFEILSLEGVLTTSAAVIPNITKITINVTVNYTAPQGHQAPINVTVAGNASGVCGNKTVNLTGNVTRNVSALPVPAPAPAPAPEGGGGCATEQTVCGPCQEGYQTCVTDRCGTTTTRVRSCPVPREIPCNRDADCPTGEVCRNNQCVEEVVEIEELPAEMPFIVYPPTWLQFFNPDVVDYPTPGIIEAVRQNLLVLPSKIDLSIFNLYYAPQETHLAALLKGKPFWKRFTYAFLITLLLLSIFLIIFKAVQTGREESVEYSLKYTPPNQ